jgi:uncharacterized protein
MTEKKSAILDRLLCWWSTNVLRFPWLILLLAITVSGFSLHYTIHNLGVNTDTSELLSADLPFQKNRFRWEKAFPYDASTMLLVVEADTPEQSSLAASRILDVLSKQTELFDFVYITDDNPFFRQQAFLYLELNKLEDLAAKLTEAQPFIGHLAANFHLQGLLEILGKALTNNDVELSMNLDPILQGIDQSLVSVTTGGNRSLSWQQLLSINPSDSDDRNRHIVSVRPKVDFKKLQPAEEALAFSKATAAAIESDISGVTIRLTGEKALEQEELDTLANDMPIAGSLAMFLVFLVLMICLRSFKLVFATFLVLIMGLIMTAGYAALAVGHLNVLSVAFAVLYIGLGVDFAIHICLRYRECKDKHTSNTEALHESMQSLGFSLFLCSLTTSIGFFAFVPTDYAGVSELGLISGGGMFIGFIISMSVLPALLKILANKNLKPLKATILPDFICTFPFRHAISIRIISVLLAVIAAFFLTKLSFDSDPVNLRNPHSESVLAFKELLQSKKNSPFALFSLAEDLNSAEQLAAQLQKLPTVNKTITLQSFVAEDQEQKLEIIDDLNLVLSTDLDQFNRPLVAHETRQALLEFHQQIANALDANVKNASTNVLQTLQSDIQAFLDYAEADPDADITYNKLEESVLSLLPYTMNQLSVSLTAYAFDLQDLPNYVSRNWVSADGIYKVMAEPEKNMNSDKNLREFVAEVQTIDANATGLPVGDIESGKAVVKAFVQAFIGALVGIIIILIIILRSFRNTLLVIWPLLLAGLLTGAINVILDNPFNFANIIALPLLMGMGVDSGIHIMHRLHSELRTGEHLLQTSTARGVFFSSLTTLCSFSSLAFTEHAGIASMGMLLAVGISLTLICTLIILPAFSSKKIPL